MLSGRLFDKTIFLLETALDIRLKRHTLIAANIANIDTPNYRPKEISFEGELKTALSSGSPLTRTHPQHLETATETATTAIIHENPPHDGIDKIALSSGSPLTRTHPQHLETATETATTAIIDENPFYRTVKRGVDTADLDREMAKLAQNNLMYYAAVRMLSKKFEALKTAIGQGGR